MNRTRILMAATVVAALLAWWWWPTTAAPSDYTVAAAGGMACASSDPRFAEGAGRDGWCEQAAVSDIVVNENPDVVFGLGDYQYEEARADDYSDVYDPSWGRVRSITRPALGNQEYKVHEANTFTDYFGERAPDATAGWYSYDLGDWHVVVLNSNCELVDGCGDGSPQMEWLMSDLQQNDHECTVAYWHHPRWSTGLYGGDERVDAFWRALSFFHADVVVSAHEHDYERFVPLGTNGTPSVEGITSFVSGVGGQAAYGPDDTAGGGDLAGSRRLQADASAVRVDQEMGALFLTLREGSFEWRFVGTDDAVLDQGSRECVK